VEAWAVRGRLSRVRLGVRAALGRQRAYSAGQGYRRVVAEAHPGYGRPTYLVLQKQLDQDGPG